MYPVSARRIQRCERLLPLAFVGCPSAAARVSSASSRALAAPEALLSALRSTLRTTLGSTLVTAFAITGFMCPYLRRYRAARGTLDAPPMNPNTQCYEPSDNPGADTAATKWR